MITASFKSDRVWAYLQLIRPANVVTAWADILAGFAASSSVYSAGTLAWLVVATTGLYSGGIIFNDVFDTELDTQERPERPIPSGRASRRDATILGSLLLLTGIVAAMQVSWLSGILATGIALAALIYDAFGKHHPILGPINMGLCRGGNLLLGVSAVPAMVGEYWFLAAIPILYIAAITSLSRSEVEVTQKHPGITALILVMIVIAGLLGLGILQTRLIAVLPLAALFTFRVLVPVIKVVRQPSPELIRQAVRAGILSLIVLDATMAAACGGLSYGLLTLCLLPISLTLAKAFAVT